MGDALAEAVAFLLPVECPGCGRHGVALCPRCRDGLRPEVRVVYGAALPVHAALRYDGEAMRVIRALKERGRTDLCRALAPAVRAALSMAAERRAMLVPVPTSRAAMRRRGYRVPELLVRRSGAPVSRLLVPERAAADQRLLGREERRRNVAGSMRARRPARSDDPPAVLFDDVVTTGATLDEARRALERAGFAVSAAVALANTPMTGSNGG